MARVCSRLLVPFLRCSFIYPSRTLPRQLTRPPIEAQGEDLMSRTNKRPKMTTREKRLAYFEKMLKRLCTNLGPHPSGTRAYEKATGMYRIHAPHSAHARANSGEVEVYPTTCSKFRSMIFRSQPFSGKLSSTVSGYSPDSVQSRSKMTR